MKNYFIKLLFILLLFVFVSCSKDEPIEIIDKKFEVSIDNSIVITHKSEMPRTASLDIITQCEFISIGMFIDNKYILEIGMLKNGVIQSAKLFRSQESE